MKKFIWIILFGNFFLENAICQMSVCIKPCINYSNFDPRQFYGDYTTYKANKSNLHYRIFPRLELGLDYKLNRRFILSSGVGISLRGYKEYLYIVPNRKDLYITEYAYLEFPLLVTYQFAHDKISIGTGLIINHRLESNPKVYEEIHHKNGLDWRAQTYWHAFKRISFGLSYTYGNFDKYLYNIRYNYLHHVFSLEFKYEFWKINLRKN